MKNALRHLLFSSCMIILCCTAVTGRAAEKWLRLASEHFDMLSCASERDSRQLLVQLEQFHEFFIKFISSGRVYDPRLQLFVFDADSQYTPYKPRAPDGKTIPSAGHYIAGAFLPRSLMVNTVIEQGRRTVFHEYTHSLVQARMGAMVPVWFNEGLATVCATFTPKGDAVTIGRDDGRYVALLSRESLIPLNTFFTVDRSSKYYNERDSAGVFYSQSWLLLHYAIFGKQTGEHSFGKLLHFAIESTIPGSVTSEVFARVFGSDYEKLERALTDYMHYGNAQYGGYMIPAKPIREKITARPATSEELEIELAAARWFSNKAPDAGAVLLGLEKKYPWNPRVYEILAEMKMAGGHGREVIDFLRKAVERKSASPMVYVWLLRYYYAESDFPLGYIMPGELAAEYTNLVDRALELAPDNMEAYQFLALIESQKADMRITKMNEVLKALPRMRDPGMTNLALAVVYWRLKRYDEAGAVINVLLQDPKSVQNLTRRARELQQRIAVEAEKP